MPRGQQLKRKSRRFAPADALPPSRSMAVRAGDGTRLHAEIFGPEDGYPIVLAHGITCAIRVWACQIHELARDYRVIAYDHRGHGRSGVPSRRANYGLNFLAADLDAVLEATLKPGRRRSSPAIRWAASRSRHGPNAIPAGWPSAPTPSP